MGGPRPIRVLLLLGLALAPARAQVRADLSTPLPLKPGNTLIIGFLGGWDRWDDQNRGVRKLALKLRNERPPGVFVETIGNHQQQLALDLIKRAFSDDHSGARIILYGQSLGGGAVVNMARKLAALGIPVLLTVQVDSVGAADGVIPANVRAAANLYQHDGPPIMGRGFIRAADPSRTAILGNLRYRYWFSDVDMSADTWARKNLGGAHARMEQDPRVWAKVEQFILHAIPQ